jgi:diguanylate cyclase (GGDEF)-like protein
MAHRTAVLPRAAVVGACAVVVACLGLLLLLPATAADNFSDVAQLVSALGGSAAAAWHVRLGGGRRTRVAWALLSLACAAWGAGQAFWCTVSLTSSEVPFPSLADVGFLAFPVLAAGALVVHPAGGGRTSRLQRLLDGMLTAGSLGLVGWLTSLGAVAHAGVHADGLAPLLLLAYPSSDVLLVVLTVLVLSRAARHRTALSLVGSGVVALGVSDSAFAYLGATGTYDGGLIDLGWIAGFLLIAVAGLCGAPTSEEGEAPADDGTPGGSGSVLPYVPVLVALATVAAVTTFSRPLSTPEMLTACSVVLCLLGRQYLSLRENRCLAADLAARERQLRYQAFHDPLTGLANRALFADRLEHALALHARSGRPVGLVFVDLDGFKAVNDTFGHAAGDDLLARVAERVAGVTRAGDTVARLGGDEFAVLLEDGDDPVRSAERIAGALARGFALAGGTCAVRASIGVTALGPDDVPASADDLLARSDAAMYAAKRAGKGTIVRWAGSDRGRIAGVPVPALP